eukprot:CAMPEP_0174841780 /NCGR_PEP_ID=MMETSP1114-20130205/9531_1 /TAXON_ID=312471 /ORGANISM="Neobodo designis, Strain CCAP 1951/1" /LENGTH=39 /DNA_ID= /DNA_START= /DNA_END= /DNA_ORIENTATION=
MSNAIVNRRPTTTISVKKPATTVAASGRAEAAKEERPLI